MPIQKFYFEVFFALKQVFSPTASPPDEALPVFALLLAAGVAARRRLEGRAGSHRPVCWLELATRQVHEDVPRPAQPAAALGARLAGPHREPSRAPTGHQLATPGLVATRRSHRPAAHTRGDRPHQDSLCRLGPAAPVEDEPSGSASKRRKIHVDPIARDWFLDMLDRWKTERLWDMRRCLCEVQRLCPGMFDGINVNTPYRWKRSAPRAETRGRRSMLSPADTTRLSEHIMKVTDVLCLSAVTIRSLVLEWLDAEGLDVHPSD